MKWPMLLWLGILIFFHFIQNNDGKEPQVTKKEIQQLRETVIKMKQVRESINVKEKAVLFLGDTKSGISTTINFLADLQVPRTTSDSLLSQTIFPIEKKVGDLLYYDLPGLNSQKQIPGNGLTNIVTASILHDIFESSKYVKLVLVVDSKDIFSDNLQILDFFKSLQSLLRRGDTYTEGILLVITKTDVLPTETLTRDVIRKLTQIEDTLQYNTLTSDEETFILDIIKNLKHKTQEKVVFIPNLHTLTHEQLKKLRDNTNSMIQDLKFVDNGFSFGFPISYTSEKTLHQIVATLQEVLREHLKSITNAAKKYFEIQAEETIDAYQLLLSVEEDEKTFKEIHDSIKYSANIRVFLESLHPILTRFNLHNTDILFAEVEWMDEAVEMIKRVTEERVTFSPKPFNEMLDEILGVLHEMSLWYGFLFELYDELSGFHVQTNRQLFNVKNIADWGKEKAEQGLIITADNFHLFLETVTTYFQKLKSYEGLRKTKVNGLKLEEVNTIIDRTLKTVTQIIQDDEGIHLFGHRVTLGEAGEIIEAFREIDNETSAFSIMTTNSFIVDSNITLGPEVQLAVYAPSWISDRFPYRINLTGEDAEEWSNDTREEIDGRPGLPGRNGGTFLGLGHQSFNLTLNLTSAGGKGGNGENGLNGKNGTNNANIPISNSPCNVTASGHGTYAKYSSTYFYDPLACGGDGGNGGAAGIGGKAGELTIDIVQQEYTYFSKQSRDGLAGREGLGGKAGIGGLTKQNKERYCTSSSCTTHTGADYFYVFPPGKPGKNGTNTNGIQQPHKEKLNFLPSLNAYYNLLKNGKTDKFSIKNINAFIPLIEQKLRKFESEH